MCTCVLLRGQVHVDVVNACLSNAINVTGFAKTIPKATKGEIQITAILHSGTIQIHQVYMTVDGQVCFYRQLFADPVKPRGCTTGPLLPLRGTNKTVCSAKLPSGPILCIVAVYVDYWRHSTAVCVLMEGIAHLWLPACPHHPSTPYTRNL